jgi:hypothetical protein
VRAGRLEVKKPLLLLEAPEWKDWNKIEIGTCYDLEFQWQQKQFLDKSYFMLVVDFPVTGYSLRIVFDLKKDYGKLKMLQGERTIVVVRNFEEFIEGVITRNPKPGICIEGINPMLLNMVDICKSGFDVGEEFSKKNNL